MKQVAYDFDWVHIVIGMVDLYQMEDGLWRVELMTESVSTSFPHFFEAQKEGAFPSHLVRMIGVKFIKTEEPGYMVFEVKDGEVQLGSNTNQRRHEESSGSSGEDSKLPRKSYPPRLTPRI